MKLKKIVLLAFVLALLSTTVTGRGIRPVQSNGTIYIRPDGSIEFTDKIQLDGNAYTINDNIYDEIVVEKSNIVIDGNRYTVQGSESGLGFNLIGVTNVTIKNTNINGFDYGIYLNSTTHNVLQGNNITNNGSGIFLLVSSNNTVSGNNIESNLNGIWLRGSSDNRISGNNIKANNNYGIGVIGGLGVGLPVSSNNTIFGNNLENNGDGIWLGGTSENRISGNNIEANREDGIVVTGSSNNTFSGNNIRNNDGGIVFWGFSTNSSISGNNITKNYKGIWVRESSNHNIISRNNITNNNYGASLFRSSNNTLRNNDASNNKYNLGVYGSELSHYIQDFDELNTVDGKPVYYWVNKRDMAVPLDAGWIALVSCTRITVKNLSLTDNEEGVLLAHTTNSTITKNNITNNEDGVHLFHSSNNIVSGNTIRNNSCGLWVRAFHEFSDNFICHNNFLDNTKQVYSYDSTNVWDNGVEGNYWSDYEDRYPDAEEIDDSGIWNTPYVIDTNNQDSYPLISQWTPEEEVEKEGDVPFWTEWWFWTIVVAGILVLAGAVYFMKKRRRTRV